jgi:protein-arginine kinase activator protein McsA
MRCSNCGLEVSSLVPVIRNGEYKPVCIDCFFTNDQYSNVIDIVNTLLISSKDEGGSEPSSVEMEYIEPSENSLSDADEEIFQPFSEASSKLPDMIKQPITEKMKKMEALAKKLSEKDRLLIALSEAIRNEQYENAGILRDKIQKLNTQTQKSENQSAES